MNYGDPQGKRYPMPDEHHVRSALQAVMWQINHMGKNRDRIAYLQEVHDRILDRATELHMELVHDCEMCNVKVQFT